MNWDYIAGFFDGEGWVGLDKRGRVRTSIAQKNGSVLRQMKHFLDTQGIYSTIYLQQKSMKCLIITRSQEAKKFLENIQDKCVVKRQRVLDALRLGNFDKSHTRPSTDEINKFIELRRTRMSLWEIGEKLGRNKAFAYGLSKKFKSLNLPKAKSGPKIPLPHDPKTGQFISRNP